MSVLLLLWRFLTECLFRKEVPKLLVLLALMGTVSLWMIDVNNVLTCNGVERASNGFFSVSAQKLFHIGLYGAVAVIWFMVFLNPRKGHEV